MNEADIKNDMMGNRSPVMEIKTAGGIARGMPLSDLQMNNRILLALTVAFYVALVTVIWVIWKVLNSGAVNNYIKTCV